MLVGNAKSGNAKSDAKKASVKSGGGWGVDETLVAVVPSNHGGTHAQPCSATRPAYRSRAARVYAVAVLLPGPDARQ